MKRDELEAGSSTIALLTSLGFGRLSAGVTGSPGCLTSSSRLAKSSSYGNKDPQSATEVKPQCTNSSQDCLYNTLFYHRPKQAIQ